MSTIPPTNPTPYSGSQENKYSTLTASQINMLNSYEHLLFDEGQSGDVNQNQLNAIKSLINSLLNENPPLSPEQQKYLAQAQSIISAVQNDGLPYQRLIEAGSLIGATIQANSKT